MKEIFLVILCMFIGVLSALVLRADSQNQLLQRAVCEEHQQLNFELFVVRELGKVYDVDKVLSKVTYPLTTPMTEWTDSELKIIYGGCR
jgi:hypothetical protein